MLRAIFRNVISNYKSEGMRWAARAQRSDSCFANKLKNEASTLSHFI